MAHRFVGLSFLLALAAAAPPPPGPCDILVAAGAPCVAAHSTTRALYAAFAGALYAVRRGSDNATLDIAPLTPGGVADASRQDAFCRGAACAILRIYDQSPRGNHLAVAGGGTNSPQPDAPVDAARAPAALAGGAARVYGAYFAGHEGYRNDTTSGVPTGNAPEVLVAVFGGRVYNDRCCLD